jgi:hypothetical protein
MFFSRYVSVNTLHKGDDDDDDDDDDEEDDMYETVMQLDE